MRIEDSDIAAFKDRGYLLLSGGMPSDLLARWRDLAERLERQAVAAHKAGAPLQACAVTEVRGDARAYRIDEILRHDAEAVIELLACPAMMAVAGQLSGPGTVPLAVDIVYKHPYPYPHILWHQGARHSREHAFLNIGLYLDDSDAGDGCLRYVPGTQNALLDVGALSAEHGWNPPGVVEVPTRAGDILVQDMMILHGSEPKRTPGPRRTVYVEFRQVDGIQAERSQSEEWVRLRERWMAHVLERARPEDRPDDWGFTSDPEESLEELAAAILARWERPIPANYAPMPVEHPEYPTPSDLRHLDR